MIRMEWTLGSIYLVSEKAVQMARDTGQEVQFSFNGIELRVMPHYSADQMAIEYSLRVQLRDAKANTERFLSRVETALTSGR